MFKLPRYLDTFGKTFGAESLGKGLDRLYTMADQYYVFGTGESPHERPSFWLSLLFGGVVLPGWGAQLVGKKGDTTYQRAMEEAGAYSVTNIWDYAYEYYLDMKAGTPAGLTAAEKAALAAAKAGGLKKTGTPGVGYNGRYQLA